MSKTKLGRGGLPWSKAEDQTIKKLFEDKMTVKEIYRKHFLGSRSLIAVERRVITLRLNRGKRKGLDSLIKDGKEVGLTLLSKTYKGVFNTYRYRCDTCGKAQSKEADQVRYNLSGCRHCMDVFVTIEDARSLARAMGGRCLSKKYLPKPERMHWQCAVGHKFWKTYAKVQQMQWCPDCSPFISERIVRAYLEQLTGVKFPKTRGLAWLSRNGEAHQLELDGYSAELNAAFELWGRQHYMPSQFFHKKKSFSQIQLIDFFKMFAAYENKTKMIFVPELGSDLHWDDLKEYLIKQIKKHKLPLVKNAEALKINLTQVLSIKDLELQRDAKRIIKENKGRLVDELPLRPKQKFQVQCNSDHPPFKTNLENLVRRKLWCKKCGYAKAGKRRRHTIEDINRKIRPRGYICVTAEKDYQPGPTIVLKFQCLKTRSHAFSGMYSNYVGRKNANCPDCSQNRRWTAELVGKKLSKIGIEVVEFNGSGKESVFKCQRNHVIRAKWRNINKRIKRGTSVCDKCSEL